MTVYVQTQSFWIVRGNSVGFVKTPKADTISTATFDYENRRVDRDFTKTMVLKTEIFINIK
jgi:hypothetical protein